MAKTDNLKLWSEVEKTDPKYTKQVGYGSHKFTTIDAQFQLMMATKQWGSYGSTWGLKDISHDHITGLVKDQVMAHTQATFYYPGGEFPLSTSILIQSWNKKGSELRVDDEWAKKVETDLTTKALSKLGFNADVFMGKFDDNKYVKQVAEEFKKNTPKAKLSSAQYKAMLKFIEEGKADVVKQKLTNYELTKEQKDNFKKLFMATEKLGA